MLAPAILLVLVVGMLWTTVGSASAAPTWLAPKDISDLNESITFPDVAVNAAGDAVAIWPRVSGGETILEAIERPAGGDWSEPVILTDPAEDQEPAATRVALDGEGNAVAVWRDSHDSVIRTAERPAGGEWSGPENLSAEGRGGSPAQLAGNAAGDLVAVWRGFSGSTHEAAWAAVRVAGGGWSEPEVISDADAEEAVWPAANVAIDAAGNAIAVWKQQVTGDDIIRAAERPAGGEWSEPEDVSAGGDGAAPRIAMNAEGAAVAAWSVLEGGVTGIQAAVRPAGGAWSDPDDLSAAGDNTGEPEVAINADGSAFALWHGLATGGGRVLRAATLPPGDEWSQPEEISDAFTKFWSFDLTVHPVTGAVSTWTREGGISTYGVQAAVRPPGGEWSGPDDLSAAGENAGLPELGFDALGNAVAIWGREDGDDYTLQGAGYDFTGPRLDDLQIPATGTAGEPVSFSVSPFDLFSLGATSWTFGDGSLAAGGNAASHVYAAPGTYPVTVSALDASGNASMQTEAIAIAAGPDGPPPPPPPPPPPSPPHPQITLALQIETRALRKLKRTGVLRIAVSVNEAARVALRGRARLRIRRPGGGPRTKLVAVFAPKTVRCAAGGKRKVALALSKRGRSLLRPLSRARLLVSGKAHGSAGGAATTTAAARTLR
jgi:hypothetical protein